jgi:PTH1 family peptidyl-tRNA hydrolase
MLLLVGLGNPGPRYVHNRHNVGFMALDEIVARHGFGPWRRRFQSYLAEGRIGNERVIALKPQTYMNESGRAVGEALRFFKLGSAQVLVIHDEIDLASGKIKVKLGGGAGGHNGLRSLDAHIGPDYRRLRIGVGHPGHKDLVQAYVLKDFAKADAAWLDRLLEAIGREVVRLVAGDDAGFMSRVAFLTAPPKPPAKPKPEKSPDAPVKTEDGGDGL